MDFSKWDPMIQLAKPHGIYWSHIFEREKACQSREREVHAEFNIRPARSELSRTVRTTTVLRCTSTAHRQTSRANLLS